VTTTPIDEQTAAAMAEWVDVRRRYDVAAAHLGELERLLQMSERKLAALVEARAQLTGTTSTPRHAPPARPVVQGASAAGKAPTPATPAASPIDALGRPTFDAWGRPIGYDSEGRAFVLPPPPTPTSTTPNGGGG
jgi:hypothetical protein